MKEGKLIPGEEFKGNRGEVPYYLPTFPWIWEIYPKSLKQVGYLLKEGLKNVIASIRPGHWKLGQKNCVCWQGRNSSIALRIIAVKGER